MNLEDYKLNSVQEQALTKAADESIKADVPELQVNDLTEIMEKSLGLSISRTYNTVHEYTPSVGPIWKAPEGWTPLPDPTNEELVQIVKDKLTGEWDKTHEANRALLCWYASYTVTGSLTDTFDDEICIKKLAAWWKDAINRSILLPLALGVGRLDMSLYDPVNKVHVVLNKEATKYIASLDHKVFDDENDKRNPVKTAMMFEGSIGNLEGYDPVCTGIDIVGRRKDYTKEEIKNFVKKSIYYLFVFPTPEIMDQDNKRAFSNLSNAQFVSYIDWQNSLVASPYFHNEGALSNIEYKYSDLL